MGGHEVLVVVTRGVHVVHEWIEADDHHVLGLLSYDDLTTHGHDDDDDDDDDDCYHEVLIAHQSRAEQSRADLQSDGFSSGQHSAPNLHRLPEYDIGPAQSDDAMIAAAAAW